MFPGGGIDMNNMRDTPLLNSSYMSRISSFLGIDFVDRLAKGEVGSAPAPTRPVSRRWRTRGPASATAARGPWP